MNNFLCFRDLYSRKLGVFNPTECSSTGISDTTGFSIPILETGWIYNIWLVVNGRYVVSTKTPIARVFDYYNPKNFYSIFHVEYQFEKVQNNVEIHWYYMINGGEYVSSSIYIDVEDYWWIVTGKRDTNLFFKLVSFIIYIILELFYQ